MLFALCAFFSVSNPANAQSNYLPATIVPTGGEAQTGFIKYQNWIENPSRIAFKSTAEDEQAVYYTPTEAEYFEVAGERYYGAVVNKEVSSTRRDQPSLTAEPKLEQDTAFLLQLFAGEKNLYVYKDNFGKEHFYIGPPEQPELLVYKIYQEQGASGPVIAERKAYLEQLSKYLAPCGSIFPTLTETDYERDALKALFAAYYDCRPVAPEYVKQKEKVAFEWGAVAGFAMTTFSYDGGSMILSGIDHSNSSGVTAGIYLDIVFPRGFRRWSVYNELYYSSYSIGGSYQERPTRPLYTVTYDYQYLKLANMLRYRFPLSSKMGLHVNAGISNGVVIGEENRLDSTLGSSSDSEPAFSETRGYEQAVLLGFGLGYDAFSLDFRYERGNGFSPFSGASTTTQRFCFLLGYRF